MLPLIDNKIKVLPMVWTTTGRSAPKMALPESISHFFLVRPFPRLFPARHSETMPNAQHSSCSIAPTTTLPDSIFTFLLSGPPRTASPLFNVGYETRPQPHHNIEELGRGGLATQNLVGMGEGDDDLGASKEECVHTQSMCFTLILLSIYGSSGLPCQNPKASRSNHGWIRIVQKQWPMRC